MGDLLINVDVNLMVVSELEVWYNVGCKSTCIESCSSWISDHKIYGPVELKVDECTNQVIKRDSQDMGWRIYRPLIPNKETYVSFKVKIPKNVTGEDKKIYEELRREEDLI